jgi:hypothetical protein
MQTGQLETRTIGGSELAILGEEGDTKIVWNKDNEHEVENARRSFNDLRKKGFMTYSVEGKKGEKKEQIHEFDPDAERIIMSPPLVGG